MSSDFVIYYSHFDAIIYIIRYIDNLMANLINTPEWQHVVKRLLKSEMEAHGLRYRDLCVRLAEQFGTIQTEANLRQKVGKGTLGAQLFLQLLLVMNTQSIESARVRAIYNEIRQNN